MLVDWIHAERRCRFQQSLERDFVPILPSPYLHALPTHGVGYWDLTGEESDGEKCEYGSLGSQCVFRGASVYKEASKGNEREESDNDTEDFRCDGGMDDI